MTRSISTFVAGALAVLCLTASVSAQVVLYTEDFSSATGFTPPAGWTTSAAGTNPTALWRFDNPGARLMDAPVSAPFAICDADIAGSGTNGIATLTSTTYDLSFALGTTLYFDQQLRDLTSGWSVEVFDGSVWNVVAAQANNTTGANIGYGSVPNVVTTNYDITAAAGASPAAQLRWVYTYGWDWWWAIDNIVLEEPPPFDLGVTSVDAPNFPAVTCTLPSSPSTVTCTVMNGGGVTLPAGTAYNMLLRVDGVNVANEPNMLAAPLAAGASFQYTYTAGANITTAGAHDIICRVVLPGDSNPANDQLQRLYTLTAGVVVTPGYVENFDTHTVVNGSNTVPLGWTNVVGDSTGTNGDWLNRTGLTPSTNGGPLSGDHTTGTGWYMYIEDSGTTNTNISLRSPCLDTSTATNPTVTFWQYSDVVAGSADDNPLSIDIIADDGSVLVSDYQVILGNGIGSGWTQQAIDLSPFAPATVRVQFRCTNAASGFVDDEAIDDFEYIDFVGDTGQAPQPGLAVFDIENSVNLSGFPVASNQNGPYFTTVTQGSSFTMSWAGQANQPLTSFFAPLNRASATFGPIGQMDCGVGPINMAGFPSDLVVFGNGILWATTPGAPFGFDALWITNGAGTGAITLTMPNFGLAPGTPLTTFQFGILSPAAPFSYLSNAVEVSVN